MSRAFRARAFAERAHGGQMYGEHPYVKHLDDVAAIVAAAFRALPFPDPHTLTGEMIAWCGRTMDVVPWAEEMAVAYLHDVVEDTTVGFQELSEEFGTKIANCVVLLSDPPGRNREERKAALHRKLLTLDPKRGIDRTVLVVKPADRLANLRESATNNPALLEMYRREAPDFRAATFRPGICDDIWREIDSIVGGT